MNPRMAKATRRSTLDLQLPMAHGDAREFVAGSGDLVATRIARDPRRLGDQQECRAPGSRRRCPCRPHRRVNYVAQIQRHWTPDDRPVGLSIVPDRPNLHGTNRPAVHWGLQGRAWPEVAARLRTGPPNHRPIEMNDGLPTIILLLQGPAGRDDSALRLALQRVAGPEAAASLEYVGQNASGMTYHRWRMGHTTCTSGNALAGTATSAGRSTP